MDCFGCLLIDAHLGEHNWEVCRLYLDALFVIEASHWQGVFHFWLGNEPEAYGSAFSVDWGS